MLFLLLALPQVLWKRRSSALSFIGALENQNFSPTFLEKTIHPKWDYNWNVGLILAPPLRFTGSVTHGSFPVELSGSPESMQTADRESQVSLQGKRAAWDPAWLLSEPMCCSETCQLQFVFFPQWRNFLSEISSQLCSVLLLLLQMGKAKRPREPHTGKAEDPGRPGITAGLQSWLPQPNHEYTSEMSDIPSRIKYVYSL